MRIVGDDLAVDDDVGQFREEHDAEGRVLLVADAGDRVVVDVDVRDFE